MAGILKLRLRDEEDYGEIKQSSKRRIKGKTFTVKDGSCNIMKRTDFNYILPKELIAQNPLKQRDSSRLMVLDRCSRSVKHKVFKDIITHVESGDCLVLNNTKVVPVRLLGKRKTGANVEIFILNPGERTLRALVRPSKRIKEGETVELENGMKVTVGGVCEQGRIVEFEETLEAVLSAGHMPLPPS